MESLGFISSTEATWMFGFRGEFPADMPITGKEDTLMDRFTGMIIGRICDGEG